MKLRSFSELENLLPQPENERATHSSANTSNKFWHDGKKKTLTVTLDSKGRKGKSVTVIAGFQHNPAVVEEIARFLKKYCGAGGTVKGLVIEIQGDQRATVSEKLRAMNYLVK